MLTTAAISSALDSSASGYVEKLKYDFNDSVNLFKDQAGFKLSVFSKHLQWLDYSEMAKVAATIGFDGVDLTVRPQGHVLPENVEEDLPKAVTAVRNAGLQVYMITTAINSADDPKTERILKTAAKLGIRHYRMGYFDYVEKLSIEENLMNIKDQLYKLSLLNEKYSIYGEYQNHSGVHFGAAIWDLYTVVNQLNTPWIGSQYDICHATVEGANTWSIGLKLLKPFIKSIPIKDFKWTNRQGKWLVEYVPLGEGMVDFKEYFTLMNQYKISVPVSIHYEYPLGGAEHGANTITMKKEDVMSAMRKDLITLKKFLAESKLIDPVSEK